MKEDCAVHAYVLMTNHLHLLARPSRGGQIGRIMRGLGRHYVRSMIATAAAARFAWF